jgi:hypothetical protein
VARDRVGLAAVTISACPKLSREQLKTLEAHCGYDLVEVPVDSCGDGFRSCWAVPSWAARDCEGFFGTNCVEEGPGSANGCSSGEGAAALAKFRCSLLVAGEHGTLHIACR